MYATCLAAKLLAALGLGTLVRTIWVPGGGNPNWWFVAMPLGDDHHGLLNLLGIHAASTPSLQTVTARNAQVLVKPPRAPDVHVAEVVPGERTEVMSFMGLTLPAVAMPSQTGALGEASPDTGAQASAPMAAAANPTGAVHEEEGSVLAREEPREEASWAPEAADNFGE